MGVLAGFREKVGDSRGMMSESQVNQLFSQAFGPQMGSTSYIVDERKVNRGWTFAANRQIGGRGARTGAQLFMTSNLEPRRALRYLRERRVDQAVRAGHMKPVHSHPFLDLITKPNSDESGLVLHWRQILQLQQAGRCYVAAFPEVVEIRPLGEQGPSFTAVRIADLRLLEFDRVKVEPDTELGKAAGKYIYTSRHGAKMTFKQAPSNRQEREEWKSNPDKFAFRIVLPDATSYEGASPTKAMERAHQISEGLDRMHWNQLDKGLHAGLVFMLKQASEDLKRFKETVMMLKAGVGHAGEPMFVPEKLAELHKNPMTNNEMGYGDLDEKTRKLQLAGAGANEAAVGMGDNLNRATIWGMEHILATGTIDPLNELIADAYNNWILPLYPGQSDNSKLVCWYDSAKMNDPRDEAALKAILVKSNIYTPNDAREEYGKEPHPDGDVLVGVSGRQSSDPGPGATDPPSAGEEQDEVEDAGNPSATASFKALLKQLDGHDPDECPNCGESVPKG